MPGNSMHIINFNKAQLPKRYKFKKTLGGYSKNKKIEFELPKATNKQLRDIAKRLKEEHQLRMVKVIVLTIILFIGLVAVFIYAEDGLANLFTY
jgi:hypothetical protein